MNILKSLYLKLLFFTIMPLSSFCQFTLTIEIDGLRNNNGQILVELCDEKEIKIKGVTQAIIDKKCILVIENLKAGKYAFRYFHDENKNEKMDVNWIGMPKEGYGFSNIKGAFLPPPFEKTIFEIRENNTLKCNPRYIKF